MAKRERPLGDPVVSRVHAEEDRATTPTEGRTRSSAGIDAFVGNPPFMGERFIANHYGEHYKAWLKEIHPGTSGKFDLCAQFLRRAHSLVCPRGTAGFVLTRSVSEGGTRTTGLQWLLSRGAKIHFAVVDLPWPGNASVRVALVGLQWGLSRMKLTPSLDDVSVPEISSQLLPERERPDTSKLQTNANISFMGSYLLGMGFTFDDVSAEASPLSKMQELLERDPHNGEVIRPYLGGSEFCTHPTQQHRRYVVDFGEMTEAEACRWPEIFSLLEETVRPYRMTKDAKKYPRMVYEWWKHWNTSSVLYKQIATLQRCLVTCVHAKHVLFGFQRCDLVFANSLYVFALDTWTAFAVLQSRIHERWARRLSSSLGDGIRYTATDCFDTFPFPLPEPRAAIAALEAIGERLYATRQAAMVGHDVGLTSLYNALKDAECSARHILELRKLHEDMDRAILAAYGWNDILVPPFCIATEQDSAALRSFEEVVIDRLFELNETRANNELARKPTRRGEERGGVAPMQVPRKAKPPAHLGPGIAKAPREPRVHPLRRKRSGAADG